MYTNPIEMIRSNHLPRKFKHQIVPITSKIEPITFFPFSNPTKPQISKMNGNILVIIDAKLNPKNFKIRSPAIAKQIIVIKLLFFIFSPLTQLNVL